MKKRLFILSVLTALLLQPFCGYCAVLSLVGGFTTGAKPIYVSYSHSGRFVAVANSGDGTVSVYKVNQKSGKFTEIENSPFQSGAGAGSISYSPDDRYAVVTNFEAPSITLFKVDAASGAFQRIQTLKAPAHPEITGPTLALFSPDGRFVAMSNTGIGASDGNISVYNVHPINGTLSLAHTEGSVAIGLPAVLDFSPDGRFIAVTLPGLNRGTRFKIDPVTGVLSQGSDFSTSLDTLAVPLGIAYSHNGRFAGVANNGRNTLATYVVNPVTGHFFDGMVPTTVPTGNKPLLVQFSRDDLLVAVTNNSDQTISLYCVDQETGVFTHVGQFLTNLQVPNGIAFHPCKDFVAVTGLDSNIVNVYKVDSSVCQ